MESVAFALADTVATALKFLFFLFMTIHFGLGVLVSIPLEFVGKFIALFVLSFFHTESDIKSLSKEYPFPYFAGNCWKLVKALQAWIQKQGGLWVLMNDANEDGSIEKAIYGAPIITYFVIAAWVISLNDFTILSIVGTIVFSFVFVLPSYVYVVIMHFLLMGENKLPS